MPHWAARGRWTALAVALLIAVAGCSPDGPEADREDTQGRAALDTAFSDTMRVADGGAGRAWTLEVLSRFGRRAGGTPRSFGSIGGLAVDSAGRVWVLDRQASEVRAFHESGEHIRTVGREGQGPGEFRHPTGLDLGPGGALWVMDPRNGRITVVDTTGEPVVTHRRASGLIAVPCRCGFDREGRYHDYRTFPPEDGGEGRNGLLRLARDGTVLDTLLIPERKGGTAFFTHRTEDVSYSAPVPFTPRITWALGPEGHLWFSPQTPYRVYERDAAGDTLRIVERDVDRPPVTDRERDDALAELDWFREQGGTTDAGRIPDRKPAVRSLHVDPLGFLWVRPYRAAGAPATAFDICDPGGRYLGRLRLPSGIRTDYMVVTRDRVYAVHEDGLGVDRVVVMALDRDDGAGDTP